MHNSNCLLQVLGDVTADEFETFVDILGKLHHLSSSDGARVIIDIIIEQAELNSDFQVSTLAVVRMYLIFLIIG